MKHIFANWKMYLTATESISLAKEIVAQSTTVDNVEIALFPTALAFASVFEACKQTPIKLGAQSCNWTPRGAYTGAISAELYAEAGATYALVGHSERRHIFGETDSDVHKKMEACLSAGITPVLCIGETKQEKDEEKREYRLKKQLLTALEKLELKNKRLLIAYEPVWAIGTGEACLPADVDDVLGWVRLEAAQYVQGDIKYLYGGSVDDKNAASYLKLETVDGMLIGSASTKAETIISILHSANEI